MAFYTNADRHYIPKSLVPPRTWTWLLAEVGLPTDASNQLILLMDGSATLRELMRRLKEDGPPAPQPFQSDLNQFLAS